MTTKDLHLAFHKDIGKYPPMLKDDKIIGRASKEEYISWLEQKLCETSVTMSGRKDILVTTTKDQSK